ncbi:ABC transporter ATP-binding protein [Gorillibacterium sp. sgz5001074]|uniref:ABC transporter ATP-binding protein n=1 Tax=Gorillibacterium sp. sgz5001074 TaxID=3446695 RepID=UPI003F665E78
MQQPNPILTVQEVTRVYRNGRGIHGISMELAQGEIFGLIGPNGAGKTTLFKAISGLIPFREGEIRIGGRSIRDEYEAAMQGLGCLIEAPALFEEHTAHRNLVFHGRFYPGITPADIDEILEDVGLLHVKKEKVAGFSQGMKQRLGVALALIGQPKLLILDEPMNGLDVEGILQFRQLIRYLQEKRELTILISSHQLSELETLCTRVGLIHDGRLVSTASLGDRKGDTLEQWYVEQLTLERGRKHG